MDEREILKERFQSAVSSTVKAISGKFDIEIKFGNKANTKENSLNLPEVLNLKNLQDIITDSPSSYTSYMLITFECVLQRFVSSSSMSIWYSRHRFRYDERFIT